MSKDSTQRPRPDSNRGPFDPKSDAVTDWPLRLHALLDGGNGGVDILGNDITAIQQTAGHVLAVARVTSDHLVGRFEAGSGDISNRELLVEGSLGRHDGSVSDEREVDAWVRHKVSLIKVDGELIFSYFYQVCMSKRFFYSWSSHFTWVAVAQYIK